VVTYTDSGEYSIELIHIENGKASFRGQRFGVAA
jgi:hypothetical protein